MSAALAWSLLGCSFTSCEKKAQAAGYYAAGSNSAAENYLDGKFEKSCKDKHGGAEGTTGHCAEANTFLCSCSLCMCSQNGHVVCLEEDVEGVV